MAKKQNTHELKIMKMAEEMADNVAVQINEMTFTKSVYKDVRYPQQMLLESIIAELQKKV